MAQDRLDGTNSSRNLIGALLIAYEKQLHGQGWNNPELPQIATLIEHGDELGLGELPFILPQQPDKFVWYLGHQLAEHPGDMSMTTAKSLARKEGLVGFFYATEIWAKHEDGEYNDVRCLAAVDIWGRAYLVTRARGADTVWCDERDGIDNHVHEGLRMMTLAVQRHMPEGTGDFDALYDLQVLTEDHRRIVINWFNRQEAQ